MYDWVDEVEYVLGVRVEFDPCFVDEDEGGSGRVRFWVDEEFGERRRVGIEAFVSVGYAFDWRRDGEGGDQGGGVGGEGG